MKLFKIVKEIGRVFLPAGTGILIFIGGVGLSGAISDIIGVNFGNATIIINTLIVTLMVAGGEISKAGTNMNNKSLRRAGMVLLWGPVMLMILMFISYYMEYNEISDFYFQHFRYNP